MRVFLAAIAACLVLCASASAREMGSQYDSIDPVVTAPHHIAKKPVAHPSVHKFAQPRKRATAAPVTLFATPPAQPPTAKPAPRFGAQIVTHIQQDVSSIYERVTRAAHAAGVPETIAHAVVKQESGYRPNLRGSRGEVGLMQVLPRTAASMGESPYDLDGNLRAGMKYLALALQSSPDLCAAISGYNHGIAGRPRCTAYGRRILSLAGM